MKKVFGIVIVSAKEMAEKEEELAATGRELERAKTQWNNWYTDYQGLKKKTLVYVTKTVINDSSPAERYFMWGTPGKNVSEYHGRYTEYESKEVSPEEAVALGLRKFPPLE